MAARSKLPVIFGGGNKKQIFTIIRSFTISAKGVHTSAYDKNFDEPIAQPPIVPSYDVIRNHPETYWGPHPHTGVFGPIGPNISPDLTQESVTGPSVLDEKVRFRPLEDVDKPMHA